MGYELKEEVSSMVPQTEDVILEPDPKAHGVCEGRKGSFLPAAQEKVSEGAAKSLSHSDTMGL